MGIIALPGLGHNDQIPFLQFGSSQMTWGESGSINTQSNTDAFHVFRLAQEPNSGTYSVWRDGVLINGALTTARGDLAGLGLRKIAFGDEGGAWSGSTQVDYFRFDTTGAYAPVPVPEPATWGLGAMGLGALLMARKRRRRV
jgi:MYXO-CTERM domain-containing protein